MVQCICRWQQGLCPQGTWIEARPIQLTSGFIEIPLEELQKKNLTGYGGPVSVKYKEFKKGQSPLEFQSYLTISTSSDFSNPIVLQNRFWVSEVTRGLTKSQSIVEFQTRKDGFDLHEFTGFGSVMGVIAVLLLVIVGASANN